MQAQSKLMPIDIGIDEKLERKLLWGFLAF
jgi:hypothetical protein